MKRNILIFLLLASSIFSFAQRDSIKINELEQKVSRLKEKQESNIELLNLVLQCLGIFVAVGFSASLFFTIRNETRNTQLFNDYKADKEVQNQRNTNLYNSFLLDKETQDTRSTNVYNTFLKDKETQDERSSNLYNLFLKDKETEKTTIETTEKTIALVNRTLELAVQASERSAKSLQIRLSNILGLIEKDSINLIKNSGAFEEDKNLTTRREIQNEIHKLGGKIEGLENNLVILDQEGLDESKVIKLSPYATFIKGADQYLKEEFDDAIETWTTLLNTEIKGAEPDKLKSLTYYWIGYLNNNLGKFNDGIQNFRNAEQICIDSRRYELQRMQIETRFFNNENSFSISSDLEKLLKRLEDDESLTVSQRKNRTSKVLNTLGNVYYSNFMTATEVEEKKKFLMQSKETFLKVLNITSETEIEAKIKAMDNEDKDKQKWVIYGLAESMFHIDEENKKIAISLFDKEVIRLAEREYENREEKRTKVLAKTSQLLCLYRINPDDKDKLENVRAMIEIPLSDLNTRLTIYSQLVRKNIEYREFKNDLKQIIDGKV